jgi:tRNA threonylcarbamoyladenosine biosynthesis protein TsaB
MAAMRILALDTATLVASVAVLVVDDTETIVAAGDAHADTHSEKLLPLIDMVLQQAGLAPAALDAIACGAGPGSFTGLRIGLATAKGLCFALGKPLLLISSLAALADAARGRDVLALLDAKKREVYAGLFAADGTPLGGERVLPPDALVEHVHATAGGRPLVVIGDGAAAYPEAAARCGEVDLAARRTPDARAVARLAAARLRTGATDEVLTAAPTYIRASEAEIATVPVAMRKPGF